MVKDLLPLYYDGACSEDSRKAVEEHLAECDSCRMLLEKMQNSTYTDALQKERNDVILHHTKNIRRKFLQIGLVVIAIPLLVCLIVNLATAHTLNWFFIVLTATLVLVSLVGVPVIARTQKLLWTVSSFTVSLLILLLICCLYSGGDWFLVAASAILLGLSVVFLPAVVGSIPFKGAAAHHKGLFIMTTDTILLYLLIIVCGFYRNIPGYWDTALLITTVPVAFVWILFAVIRYFKTNAFIKAGICVLFSGIVLSLFNDFMRGILEGSWKLTVAEANLQTWNTDILNANVCLLVFLTGCAVGLILLIIGIVKAIKNHS